MKSLRLLPLLLLIVSACDFRPMADTANVSYVRVYVNDDILNVTTGFYDDSIREETSGAIDVHLLRPDYRRPEILRLGLFNPEDGSLVAERYLRNQGDDEHGHYYDGFIVAEPGTCQAFLRCKEESCSQAFRSRPEGGYSCIQDLPSPDVEEIG